MDPSLLPSKAKWRKFSIVGCPEGDLVGCMVFPLCYWLVEVVLRRSLGDLIHHLGRDMAWVCRWNLVGWGKVPWVHTDLEYGVPLMSICLLVSFPKGSNEKKEVIRRIGSALVGGWRVWTWSLRALYMYKVKQCLFIYLKTLVRVWVPLNKQWNCPLISYTSEDEVPPYLWAIKNNGSNRRFHRDIFYEMSCKLWWKHCLSRTAKDP
jgi:hypothetical protein